MRDYYLQFGSKDKFFRCLPPGIVGLLLLWPLPVRAFTANRLWYEFLPNGLYRVTVVYTIPELRELRQAYVEFQNKKEADAFYWDVLRGADFQLNDPKKRRFVSPPAGPRPW